MVGNHNPDAEDWRKVVGNAGSGGAEEHDGDNPVPLAPVFFLQPHAVALVGDDMEQDAEHGVDRETQQRHTEQRPADAHHLPLAKPAHTHLLAPQVLVRI